MLNAVFVKPRMALKRSLRRMLGDSSGATAVEFAILGLPFCALIFGVIEISVVFLITSTTEHALSETAREIRTGEFQNTTGANTAAAFKTAVCGHMAGLGKCSKLRVDVVGSGTNSFSDLTLPDSPPACTGTPQEIENCENAPPAMPADTYTSTASEQVVIVRVQYVHQLTIPNALTGLANGSGNTRIINATTAFRNEPF